MLAVICQQIPRYNLSVFFSVFQIKKVKPMAEYRKLTVSASGSNHFYLSILEIGI